MMNTRLLIYSFLCSMLSYGCFDDKGNYDYKPIEEPIWLVNPPLRISCTEGDTANFIASSLFRWASDSLKRSQEVSYEWSIRGVVIGNELDLKLSTDDLIEKIQLEKFEQDGLAGMFTIIDKNTGMKFSISTYNMINPKYYAGDWLIISEDGENTKCSFLKHKARYGASGAIETYFVLTDDIYNEINGQQIPGKPLGISKSLAPNIGSLGSTTIMTDQVAYVLDNLRIKKVSEIKDEFLDGIPLDLKIVDRRDCEDASLGGYTFVATEDGRIFRRKTSKNFLGGKFLSIPYELDNKGYKITKFGFAASGWTNVPCYDEKNRRVVIINFSSIRLDKLIRVHKLTPVTPLYGADLSNSAPVWEMPEGTNVFFLMKHNIFNLRSDSGLESYSLFYNDKNGVSYMADFIIDASTQQCVENENVAVTELPVKWDEETIFLTSIFDNKCKYLLFYSDGNEVYYLDRKEKRNTISHLLSVDSKITYMGFTSYYSTDKYNKIIIGCINGDVIVYDISILDEPKIISKFNVGGKVVDGMQLGNAYGTEIY